MQDVIVSQTREYLVLKIPLRSIKKRSVSIDPERVAVEEGIRAVEESRVSMPFNNAKEATTFLRKL